MSADLPPDSPPDRDGRAKVGDRWSDQEFTAELADIFWMASRWVRAHLNRRASGSEECDWLTWFLGRYAPPRGWPRRRPYRCLVLGCGDGWVERRLVEWPTIGTIDAQDIAAGAVAEAERTAARLGLSQISPAPERCWSRSSPISTWR